MKIASPSALPNSIAPWAEDWLADLWSFGRKPGVGKSTLLLQVADAYAKNMGRGLMFCGGVGPTTGCGPRLGISSARLSALNETKLDRIISCVEALRRPGGH